MGNPRTFYWIERLWLLEISSYPLKINDIPRLILLSFSILYSYYKTFLGFYRISHHQPQTARSTHRSLFSHDEILSATTRGTNHSSRPSSLSPTSGSFSGKDSLVILSILYLRASSYHRIGFERSIPLYQKRKRGGCYPKKSVFKRKWRSFYSPADIQRMDICENPYER